MYAAQAYGIFKKPFATFCDSPCSREVKLHR